MDRELVEPQGMGASRAAFRRLLKMSTSRRHKSSHCASLGFPRGYQTATAPGDRREVTLHVQNRYQLAEVDRDVTVGLGFVGLAELTDPAVHLFEVSGLQIAERLNRGRRQEGVVAPSRRAGRPGRRELDPRPRP